MKVLSTSYLNFKGHILKVTDYTREFHLGNLQVFWLDCATAIPAGEMSVVLHEQEITQAETLKAPARRAEHLRSRWLLHRISGYREPLLRDNQGVIIWPPAFHGSVTHKNGHVAACLTTTSSWSSVGIDAEAIDRVGLHLESKICTSADSEYIDRIVSTPGWSRQQALATVFSFKEALFKAHFPPGRIMFWFQDAELTELDPIAGRIACRTLVPTGPATPAGHVTSGFFTFVDAGQRLVLTACGLP